MNNSNNRLFCNYFWYVSLKGDLIIPAQTHDLALVNLVEWIGDELKRDPRLKSEHTRRAYKADLAAFQAWRAGRPVTRLLVEEYAASLQQAGRTPDTINRALAAIRWFARRLADRFQEQPVNSEAEKWQRSEAVSQAERTVGVKDVTGSRQPGGRREKLPAISTTLFPCQTGG